MKIEFQSRIDDYLLNRMSDEDRARFEADMMDNEELKEQLEFTETIRQALKSRNEKLAAMEEWKDDYVWKNERMTAASSSIKKILYWASGIAAVFIVGVFVFNVYRPSSTEMAMETASHPTEALSKNGNVSFRGRSQNMDIESQLAMGDYSKALARLEKDEADIRAGLMQIDYELHSRGNSYEDAVAEKDSLETNLDRVLYLKAQALIGLDRKEDARVVLEEMRQSKSEYGIKADSLYHLLR